MRFNNNISQILRSQGKIIVFIILVFYIRHGYSQPLYLENPKDYRFMDNSTQLLEFLKLEKAKGNNPGFILKVLHNNQVVFTYASGVESMETMKPLDDDSQFYLASIGKTMTAAAILKLVEDEKLKLEELVTSYFEDLPATFQNVRIYHLMSHTSGLPDHFDVLGEDLDNFTNAQVLEFLESQDSLLFQPSLDYAYSNSAYVLLSIIVEKVSKKSFSEFLSENFFQPLNMNSTIVFDSPDVGIKNRVSGYKVNAGKVALKDYSGIYTTGSGGIYSTMHDLEIWINALTDGKVIKKKRLLNLMFDFPTTFTGYKSYVGMGWTNETVGGHAPELQGLRVLGSIGFMRGFVTMVLLLPDQNLKIFLLCNTGKMEMRSAEIYQYFINGK